MREASRILGWLVFLVLAAGFCYVIWVVLAHRYNWPAVLPYWKNLLSGWGVTIVISLVSLVLSTAVGVFLTVGQLSPVRPARLLSRAYIEFVRGTPLLTQILIGYYIVGNSLGWDNRLSFGIAILSLFAGAYLAEIFRAGVESIPGSQWLSARAIGLGDAQIYRHIIVPQAIRRVLPASTGQFANLIKDSSLLYIISVPEFLMQARAANSYTAATFEAYLPLIAGYLALTLPLSLLSRRLERAFGFEQ